jgi:hypothetical protein
MPVMDRLTGEPNIVHSQQEYPEEALTDQDRVLRFVRSGIHDLEIHEADEMILYRGERIFDPHK